MADNGKRVYAPADLVVGASTARAGKRGGNPYLPEVATVIDIIASYPARWANSVSSAWANRPSPSAPSRARRSSSSSR